MDISRKTLFLTERTMSAMRPGDALGRRINCIVDRYLEIMARTSQTIRAGFDEREWGVLLRATEGLMESGTEASDTADALFRAVGSSEPALLTKIGIADTADLFALVELLELELRADGAGNTRTVPTQSRSSP